MRYLELVTDYDGTLAAAERVSSVTAAAVKWLRTSMGALRANLGFRYTHLPSRSIAKEPQRADRTKARRRQAVVPEAKPFEDRPLFFARDQEGGMPTALQRWVSQRDARLRLGPHDGGNPLLAFRQHRAAREQRSCMAIWPEPEKVHIK